VLEWTLSEHLLFEDAVGMTPERALGLFPGDDGDENAAMDVPAKVLIGFALVAARRVDPAITAADLAARINLREFYDSARASAPLVGSVPETASEAISTDGQSPSADSTAGVPETSAI
jgi:hypothetical protein